jgi:hypothetical protein
VTKSRPVIFFFQIPIFFPKKTQSIFFEAPQRAAKKKKKKKKKTGLQEEARR